MPAVTEVFDHNETVRKALIGYLTNMVNDFTSTGLPRGKLERASKALQFYVGEYIDGRQIPGMDAHMKTAKKNDAYDYGAVLISVNTQLTQIVTEAATALAAQPETTAFSSAESPELAVSLPKFKALLEAS